MASSRALFTFTFIFSVSFYSVTDTIHCDKIKKVDTSQQHTLHQIRKEIKQLTYFCAAMSSDLVLLSSSLIACFAWISDCKLLCKFNSSIFSSFWLRRLRQFLSCKGNYQSHKTAEREFTHAKSMHFITEGIFFYSIFISPKTALGYRNLHQTLQLLRYKEQSWMSYCMQFCWYFSLQLCSLYQSNIQCTCPLD